MEEPITKELQKREYNFKPGVSGNPAGKPRGTKHFKTLFKEAIIRVAEGEEESDDRLIVRKVIAMAKAGDLKAADMIMDRTEGKVVQQVETEHTFKNYVITEGDGNDTHKSLESAHDPA